MELPTIIVLLLSNAILQCFALPVEFKETLVQSLSKSAVQITIPHDGSSYRENNHYLPRTNSHRSYEPDFRTIVAEHGERWPYSGDSETVRHYLMMKFAHKQYRGHDIETKKHPDNMEAHKAKILLLRLHDTAVRIEREREASTPNAALLSDLNLKLERLMKQVDQLPFYRVASDNNFFPKFFRDNLPGTPEPIVQLT